MIVKYSEKREVGSVYFHSLFFFLLFECFNTLPRLRLNRLRLSFRFTITILVINSPVFILLRILLVLSHHVMSHQITQKSDNARPELNVFSLTSNSPLRFERTSKVQLDVVLGKLVCIHERDSLETISIHSERGTRTQQRLHD